MSDVNEHSGATDCSAARMKPVIVLPTGKMSAEDGRNGEPVAGWRVAEAMRERLLDATRYSRLDG